MSSRLSENPEASVLALEAGGPEIPPNGSCRMGLDEMAVVDPKLKVHGIDGLGVADASVMPAVASGNCHAGIVMIAERLASWLKSDYGL